MYKVEIWQYRIIKETKKSQYLEDLIDWYIEEWKHYYDCGHCMFYVYKDGCKLSFNEIYDLGFYQ